MAVLVLTSASGAPGVTTTALGLALTWTRPVLLADCDPAAQQAVLAGFLQGRRRTTKGLLRVAEAHRDQRSLPEVVMDQAIELAEDVQRRLFLPGFSRPGSARLFTSVWSDLADAFAGFGDAGFDVIVDAGRIGADGLPAPLLERARAVGMVTRTSLRAVAACRMHLAALVEQCQLVGTSARPGLVLVGEGQPYSGREIGSLVGVPVLGSIADDRDNAACISDGVPRGRKFNSSAFTRSLRHLASDLRVQLDRSAEPLEVTA